MVVKRFNSLAALSHRLPLSKHIRDLGFCSNVANALNSSAHDVRETILTAMKNLYSACSTEFSSAKTQEHLQTLQVSANAATECNRCSPSHCWTCWNPMGVGSRVLSPWILNFDISYEIFSKKTLSS